jgi:predicted butyrate kinase (DUF1464 family)
MQGTVGNSILITIMELDESGNVVFSKEINTNEVSVLPTGYVTILQDGSQINEPIF